MSQEQPNPNLLRDHLANERTFLAWMRTAITMVGLGFVVAKFGILLREVGSTHVHARTGAIVGVALVLGGMLSAVTATVRFLQIRRDLERNVVRYSSTLDIGLGIVVTVAGIVLAVYLIVTA